MCRSAASGSCGFLRAALLGQIVEMSGFIKAIAGAFVLAACLFALTRLGNAPSGWWEPTSAAAGPERVLLSPTPPARPAPPTAAVERPATVVDRPLRLIS